MSPILFQDGIPFSKISTISLNDQFREDLYFTTVTPATHCTFDKQGRIQLPQSLREYCQLDTDGMRDVVVVGGGKENSDLE